MTAEAWVLIEPGTSGGTLFFKSDVGSISSNRSYESFIERRLGRWEFSVWIFFEGGTYMAEGTTVAISDYTWNHFAFTYDGAGHLCSYVNGDLVLSKTNAEQRTIRRTARKAVIGSNWPGYMSIRGYVDEARIWTRARSQQEIRSTMNSGVAGLQPTLGGYWKFDSAADSTGKTVSRHSGTSSVPYYSVYPVIKNEYPLVAVEFVPGPPGTYYAFQVSDTTMSFNWQTISILPGLLGQSYSLSDLNLGCFRFYKVTQIPY
jgi:hypothetical protein